LKKIQERHPQLVKMRKKSHEVWARQMGSLGGENHFIEICLDENQNVWVMLRFGSRGSGNVIGRYFIQLAKKDMERHQIHLPNSNLAYFEESSEHFGDYIEAIHWAQDYASVNRWVMMGLIIDALKQYLPKFEVTREAVNCHHN